MKKRNQRQANTVIVFDFETTGLSPDQGGRAIEIGAVRIENGKVTGRFQQLMNAGRRIDSFIEGYTGITNAMLCHAPSCNKVMTEFSAFIEDFDLVVHSCNDDRIVPKVFSGSCSKIILQQRIARAIGSLRMQCALDDRAEAGSYGEPFAL